MAKKALVVGCNYLNDPRPLQGCCNDAVNMHGILMEYYGFEEANIVILLDDAPDGWECEEPTAAKILECLDNLVEGAESGDVLVFYFSGHGGSREVQEGDNDATGKDEFICPKDTENLITDEEFQVRASKIPEGVNFTFVSDSCSSGGLIDGLTAQIGGVEQTEDVEAATQPPQEGTGARRYTMDMLLESLNDGSYSEPVGYDNLWNALNEKFGDEATPSIRRRCEGVERAASTKAENVGILLSGCEAWENSIEAATDGLPSQGKFTKTIKTVLENLRSQEANSPTNAELIEYTRQMIVEGFDPDTEEGQPQHPCLYCSEANRDATFICDFVAVEC